MARATIYDIATRVGVSSSTVARVLRGDVKETQRRSSQKAARIRRVARELGYSPNLRARNFARARTRGVGLMYVDPAWVFHGVNDVAVQSLEVHLRHRGYHLVLVPVHDDDHWQPIVLGGQVDGCIALHALPAAVRASLDGASIPLVSLGGEIDPEVSHIVTDDFSGAVAATQFLIAQGHRKLQLLIADTVHPHYSVEERQRGFQKAVTEAGLECPPLENTSEEDVYDLMRQRDSRPTGVLCYSDVESMQVMHAAWQCGIRVPQDLSVIGFNDVRATRYMTPPLTTVAFDVERAGRLAAQITLRQIESPTERRPHHVQLKPRLIVRGSVGPAPSQASAAKQTRSNRTKQGNFTLEGL